MHSKSFPMKKQTLHLGWPENESIFRECKFFWGELSTTFWRIFQFCLAASNGAEKKAGGLYISVSIDFVHGRVLPPSRKTPNPVESYWKDWNSYAKLLQSNVNVTAPFRSIDHIFCFCYDLTCLNHLRTLSLNQCFYSVWSGPRRQDTVAHLPFSLLCLMRKGYPSHHRYLHLFSVASFQARACHSPIYLNGINI